MQAIRLLHSQSTHNFLLRIGACVAFVWTFACYEKEKRKYFQKFSESNNNNGEYESAESWQVDNNALPELCTSADMSIFFNKCKKNNREVKKFPFHRRPPCGTCIIAVVEKMCLACLCITICRRGGLHTWQIQIDFVPLFPLIRLLFSSGLIAQQPVWRFSHVTHVNPEPLSCTIVTHSTIQVLFFPRISITVQHFLNIVHPIA